MMEENVAIEVLKARVVAEAQECDEAFIIRESRT